MSTKRKYRKRIDWEPFTDQRERFVEHPDIVNLRVLASSAALNRGMRARVNAADNGAYVKFTERTDHRSRLRPGSVRYDPSASAAPMPRRGTKGNYRTPPEKRNRAPQQVV